MATIRERAAALNIMGKLYSPMSLPQDSKMGNTVQPLSWSAVISHLQEQVQMERRWRHLRAHKNCFVGSAAVDAIQTHVQNNYFGGLDFPRAKAVRVCQALMDCEVIEAVGKRVFGKEKKHTFQDTNCSLYRFVSTENAVLDKLDKQVISPFAQKSFHMPDTGEMKVLCHSTPVRSITTLGAYMKKDTMPHSPQARNNALSRSLVSEVWQEQTLLRLMQIMDLPFLEGLLEAKERSWQQSSSLDENDEEALHRSSFLDREIIQAFRDSQTDAWLSAALDCIGFLPDQVVVEVSRELPITHYELNKSIDMEQCKLLLFDVLAKHYSQPDYSPLLGDHMGEVYAVITEHLENGNLKLALEAIQLCLKLLPVDQREQLQKLLVFMALAADPQAKRLHKELENRMIVKRTFSKAIINHRCLSKDKAYVLVLFIMDNHSIVFQIPGSFHKLVSEKLADIQQGQIDTSSGPTFCHGYPEYVRQSTNVELLGLLRTIDEDPQYTLKDKKRLFAKFYQGHPEIFAQYFGPRLSSIISAL
ncbi:DEP domain-containing protein 7-like [Alosa sapidissima]|uniref:DEP domain-containing protein 7-like n=1 Tax=Alosa sapidissima TaxID=34773 RepID=UPI001C09F400|nr:DEP domain-containing protein 7-like [Alosa sapidissima]